jgi:hypothetical protein
MHQENIANNLQKQYHLREHLVVETYFMYREASKYII